MEGTAGTARVSHTWWIASTATRTEPGAANAQAGEQAIEQRCARARTPVGPSAGLSPAIDADGINGTHAPIVSSCERLAAKAAAQLSVILLSAAARPAAVATAAAKVAALDGSRATTCKVATEVAATEAAVTLAEADRCGNQLGQPTYKPCAEGRASNATGAISPHVCSRGPAGSSG